MWSARRRGRRAAVDPSLPTKVEGFRQDQVGVSGWQLGGWRVPRRSRKKKPLAPIACPPGGPPAPRAPAARPVGRSPGREGTTLQGDEGGAWRGRAGLRNGPTTSLELKSPCCDFCSPE